MKKSSKKKTLKEAPITISATKSYYGPDKAYYMYVHGRQAIQGSNMSSTQEILDIGMESEDVKNVGPVHMSKMSTDIGTYTTYLITSAVNTKDTWFVIAPFNKALFKEDEAGTETIYEMWRIAVANKANVKQISFDDYLKVKV